ncbi:MAG: class I SAM-dependent methyltransferase [Promethearchaeota archaeon]|nr:MAG: class I SAM-dependent methyltransferase [Candidatus Lokiarchaeota archaeon]
MNEKSNMITEGSIQETMLGPLWARATYSKLYPDLLNDQKAIQIIENVNYDFSEIRDFLGEWRAVGLMIRARRFDEATQEYIKNHPYATVINIGAGLDTTFSRIDNEMIKMYNIDLPEVITYREELIEHNERNQNIGSSVFEKEWMDQIEYTKDKGIFFIAGGFLYYFEENKVSNFIDRLAEKYPNGEIIFDTVSSLAAKIVNKRAKKAESDLRFGMTIDDPHEQIPKWSDKIEIKECFVLGDRVSSSKSWKLKTRIMNKFSNWLKTAYIIHLRFIE